jgi:hypothetical protein
MQAELNSPKHSRETSIEFKQDWTRLQNSRNRATALAASRQDLPLAAPLASNSSLVGNLGVSSYFGEQSRPHL